MNYKLLMNTAVLAGEIMLKSGAETYRVEDTIKHILNTAHTETAETIVYLTGFVVTLDNPDIDTLTIVKRVESRGTYLYRIDQVNDISRRYCEGKLSLEQAYRELSQIRGSQYKSWMYNLATFFACAGFAPLFGGGAAETAGAFVVGVVLAFVTTLGKRLKINSFILTVLSSAGIAVTAILLKYYCPSINADPVIISSIMPLVPGVAITNAIRDTLRGDYLSGASRILEAFMIAAAVALGVGLVFAFHEYFNLGGRIV